MTVFFILVTLLFNNIEIQPFGLIKQLCIDQLNSPNKSLLMSRNQAGQSNGPLLQKYKSFMQLVIVVSTFALGAFYFGYAIAYFSSIDFDSIIKIYGIDWDKTTAQGLLTGCIPIGGGIGALASDILIKRFSRRQFIFIVNAIAFAAGLLLYIKNPYSLFLVRIIQGVCVGFYSAITPVIIKETSPNEISGTLGALNQFFIAFGCFFAFFFKFVLEKAADDESGQKVWWLVFGFPLVSILLQTFLLLFVFPYETPKYLLLNGRENEARELIRVFYLEQFVEEVLEEKYQDMGKSSNQAKRQNTESVITYQNDIRSTDETENFLPKNRQNSKIAIFIALHLALLQQMVGINAVVAYGGQIAGSAIPSLKSIFPMLINLEQCLAPLVISYLLSKVGRKSILQVGTIVGSFTTALIGVGFLIRNSSEDAGNILILLGLVLFMGNFGLSLGPVVWLYIPEVVQPNIVPFSTGINWAGAALVMLLFPIIKKALPNENPSYLFFFFAIWCGVSFFINAKYTIETKGKTEKEIYEEYQKM